MHYKYEHSDFFENVPKVDFKKYSGNIVIYGAGFQGLLAAHLLKKEGIKVCCFADIDKEKQKKPYFGLPVISPDEMAEKHRNSLIIITPYILEPVYKEYKAKNFNVCTPFQLFLEFDSDDFDKLEELPFWYHPKTLDLNIDLFLRRCNNLLSDRYLYATDISITQACNLKCRECTSFMPYYKTPKTFDLNDIIRSFELISKNRTFSHVYLEGGEPFIYKNLPELINYLTEKPEVFCVLIVTNGTIIPDKRLLKTLRRPKVIVRISDYGKLSKIDELTKIFEENNVNYKIQLQKWYKMSSFIKEPLTDEELKITTSLCCKLGEGGYAHIADGKLFACPAQANLHNTGIYKSGENDYVDLVNAQDSEECQKKIETFLRGSHISKICRHCKGRGSSNIEVPPAQQLKDGEEFEIKFE